MNQVAVVFGLIITTIVGIGAYTALAPLVTQSENRNMEAELVNVINAAAEFRWVNRNDNAALAGATFQILVDRGYLDTDLYDDGADESVIGTDITVGGLGGAAPNVTYDAGDQESCNWLQDRAEQNVWANVDLDTAPACANGVLTVTVE